MFPNRTLEVKAEIFQQDFSANVNDVVWYFAESDRFDSEESGDSEEEESAE